MSEIAVIVVLAIAFGAMCGYMYAKSIYLHK